MSAVTITFKVDPDDLEHYTDEYVAQLWHIAQANPAPFGDRAACTFAEKVGREIVRRWLERQRPAMWTHQAAHIEHKRIEDGVLADATLRQFRGWLVSVQPQVGDASPGALVLGNVLASLDATAQTIGHTISEPAA